MYGCVVPLYYSIVYVYTANDSISCLCARVYVSARTRKHNEMEITHMQEKKNVSILVVSIHLHFFHWEKMKPGTFTTSYPFHFVNH